MSARIHGVLEEELARIREILTAEQWQRLPRAIREPGRQFLPPRRRRS